MPIIQLQDVSKLYGFGDATNVALDEVSLDIDEGEFVAVMGPSGCGKSTLMNVLSGVYPYCSYEGEIYFEGKEVRFQNINQSE